MKGINLFCQYVNGFQLHIEVASVEGVEEVLEVKIASHLHAVIGVFAILAQHGLEVVAVAVSLRQNGVYGSMVIS